MIGRPQAPVRPAEPDHTSHNTSEVGDETSTALVVGVVRFVRRNSAPPYRAVSVEIPLVLSPPVMGADPKGVVVDRPCRRFVRPVVARPSRSDSGCRPATSATARFENSREI